MESNGLKDIEDEIVNKGTFREAILTFEDKIKNSKGALIGDNKQCPLKHSFSPGLYVREISIPAGFLLTGKIHRHKHPNFLLKGTVQVITEEGGYELLTGPISIMSPPGTKRALQTKTQVIWVTVHHNPTNTKDLKELEKIVIAESYDDYENYIEVQEIEDKRIKELIIKGELKVKEELKKSNSFIHRIINKFKRGII